MKLGPYSLRGDYDKIEKRYLSIMPPDYLPSAPRSITEWRNWKAKEFINFIIFYALPLFCNLMPTDHFEHLKKLVIGLEILMAKHISRDLVNIADTLLKEFVADASSLYTPSIMKSGLHELIHLANCTIEFGPLNGISCFPFEELNRKLTRLIKGEFFFKWFKFF